MGEGAKKAAGAFALPRRPGCWGWSKRGAGQAIWPRSAAEIEPLLLSDAMRLCYRCRQRHVREMFDTKHTTTQKKRFVFVRL